jgi:ABC-type uncharacterized transport system ATPase subunit
MPFLEARRLTKKFGSVTANRDVCLEIRRGELTALLGENGAGKTTLARMLAGELVSDSGSIHMDGEKARIDSPQKAARLGIGLVHQHPLLVPDLSVSENICLGAEPLWGGIFLDRRRMLMRSVEAARDFGFSLNPNAVVGRLSHGERQEAEILRVLSRGAELIILDEPTSLLAHEEAAGMYALLRKLADNGKAVVVVTHRLGEIRSVADRFVFLRDGRNSGEMTAFDEDRAYYCMFGKKSGEADEGPRMESGKRRSGGAHGSVAVDARALSVSAESGTDRRGSGTDMSFSVNPGECLAFIALAGNGLEDLEFSLSGLRPSPAGSLFFQGEDVSRFGVGKRRKGGMAYIPSDRMGRGICPTASVTENILASDERGLFVFPGKPRSALEKRAREKCLAYPAQDDMSRPASELSGGQIQGLILNRETSGDAAWLLACQPGAGLDGASRKRVYDAMRALKEAGKALILLSSDIDEVLELSDRIAVLYRGGIALECPNEGKCLQRVARAMVGGERA